MTREARQLKVLSLLLYLKKRGYDVQAYCLRSAEVAYEFRGAMDKKKEAVCSN